MQIALAGRPGAGKSALFDLIAGPGASNASTGLRITHAEVPDPRVDTLSASFRPRKTTRARLEFQDLEQKAGPAYPSLSPERREMLSGTDLVLLVIDLFSAELSDWDAERASQTSDLKDEFSILDLATIESRLGKLTKLLRIGQKPAFPKELETLEGIHAGLMSGIPVGDQSLTPEIEHNLKGFGFLTARPILFAFNVGEGHLDAAVGVFPESGEDGIRPENRIVFCAEVESQINELPLDEQESFMHAFGLSESAVDQVIRAAYAKAGLHSFFTVGDDEVRAWSVRHGAKAPTAAGVIHTDLEKGFVRAEVLSYADWEKVGSLSAAKEKGMLRLEGKAYEVRDGDIMNIRSGLAKSKG